MRLAVIADIADDATPNDIARIRHAADVCMRALERLGSDYELPMTVTLEPLSDTPTDR